MPKGGEGTRIGFLVSGVDELVWDGRGLTTGEPKIEGFLNALGPAVDLGSGSGGIVRALSRGGGG